MAFVKSMIMPMGREAALAGQTVVIHDGRIAAIGPAGDIDVPRDAERIAGAGKSLMPGLINARFHLQDNDADDRRLMQMLVANGVTSILNLYRTHPSGVSEDGWPAERCWGRPSTPRAVPFPMRRDGSRGLTKWSGWSASRRRAGYDLIKTHGDFSRDAFRRLCEVARRENMKVIGHAPRNLGVEPMSPSAWTRWLTARSSSTRTSSLARPTCRRLIPMRGDGSSTAPSRGFPALATATAKAGSVGRAEHRRVYDDR